MAWVPIEFKDLEMGMKIRTVQWPSEHYIVSSQDPFNGSWGCKHAQDSTRTGTVMPLMTLEYWVDDAEGAPAPIITKVWSLGPGETQAPKAIPDYPDKCTHCGAPAYIGLLGVDCSGKCGGTR
jgi:hypothetical protein